MNLSMWEALVEWDETELKFLPDCIIEKLEHLIYLIENFRWYLCFELILCFFSVWSKIAWRVFIEFEYKLIVALKLLNWVLKAYGHVRTEPPGTKVCALVLWVGKLTKKEKKGSYEREGKLLSYGLLSALFLQSLWLSFLKIFQEVLNHMNFPAHWFNWWCNV